MEKNEMPRPRCKQSLSELMGTGMNSEPVRVDYLGLIRPERHEMTTDSKAPAGVMNITKNKNKAFLVDDIVITKENAVPDLNQGSPTLCKITEVRCAKGETHPIEYKLQCLEDEEYPAFVVPARYVESTGAYVLWLRMEADRIERMAAFYKENK